MGAGFVIGCIFLAIVIVAALYFFDVWERQNRGCEPAVKNSFGMVTVWSCPRIDAGGR